MAESRSADRFDTSTTRRFVRRQRRVGLVAPVVAMLVLAAVAVTDTSEVGAVGTAQAEEPRALCSAEHPSEAVGRARPGARSPAPVVRAATYNLLFALGTSNESLDARIPLIVDAIVSADVDVVGVQEVEVLASRGATTARVAAGLADATGERWYWCWFLANPAAPGEPDTNVGGGGPTSDVLATIAGGFLGEAEWRTGEGILSRYPILDSGGHRLSGRVPGEIEACGDDMGCVLERTFESRVGIRAVVSTPTGHLHVFSTHLAHTVSPLSEETRLAQVQELLGWTDDVMARRPLPAVLVGDFNTREGSPVHGAVTDAGFVDTFRVANPDADGFTSPQRIDAPESTVRNRIDYVFARGQACTNRFGSWWALPPSTRASSVLGDEPTMIDGATLWPSDHYGVVSELRMLPNRTAAGCVRAGPEG